MRGGGSKNMFLWYIVINMMIILFFIGCKEEY